VRKTPNNEIETKFQRDVHNDKATKYVAKVVFCPIVYIHTISLYFYNWIHWF